MPRLATTILGTDTTSGYAGNSLTPVVDIGQRQAGQHGLITDYSGYVSNADYVRRGLRAKLIREPLGFHDLPNPEKWIQTLRNLVEIQSITIEGLTKTISTEWHRTPYGKSGQEMQTIANVRREQSTPTHTWPEKYGRPVQRFLEGWQFNLLMDPETKLPNVVTLIDTVPDMLPDYTGAVVLYYETDPTGRRIDKAWLCTNWHPMTAGEDIGRHDSAGDMEGVNHTIEFTCIQQVGLGVELLAQRYLDDMNLIGVNPHVQPAYLQELSQHVDAQDAGYQRSVEAASASAVSRSS